MQKPTLILSLPSCWGGIKTSQYRDYAQSIPRRLGPAFRGTSQVGKHPTPGWWRRTWRSVATTYEESIVDSSFEESIAYEESSANEDAMEPEGAHEEVSELWEACEGAPAASEEVRVGHSLRDKWTALSGPLSGGISQLGFWTVERILPYHPPWSRKGPAPVVLSKGAGVRQPRGATPGRSGKPSRSRGLK